VDVWLTGAATMARGATQYSIKIIFSQRNPRPFKTTVGDSASKKAVVVDPGGDVDLIQQVLQKHKLEVHILQMILLYFAIHLHSTSIRSRINSVYKSSSSFGHFDDSDSDHACPFFSILLCTIGDSDSDHACAFRPLALRDRTQEQVRRKSRRPVKPCRQV
jgi:hypothetical protein